MNTPESMLHGSMQLPPDADARFAMLCEVAGALAEHGVKELRVNDPRACQTWTLHARTSNLPATLSDAAAGTTFEAPEFRLMLTADSLEWHATKELHSTLARIT